MGWPGPPIMLGHETRESRDSVGISFIADYCGEESGSRQELFMSI